MRRLVGILVVLALVAPTDTGAVSRRKRCRLGCAAAVNRCVAEGGKRARCKRRLFKRCRKEGLDVCAVTTTTTTTIVAPTSTLAGATTTLGGSTTTTPVPTTTSTSVVVHGCNSATAADLSADAMPVVSFTSFYYAPACARIVAGQTITFSGSFTLHPLVGGTVSGVTATPDPMSPIGSYATGTAAAIAFTSPGVFPFYCDFHGITQSMVGAVFVDP